MEERAERELRQPVTRRVRRPAGARSALFLSVATGPASKQASSICGGRRRARALISRLVYRPSAGSAAAPASYRRLIGRRCTQPARRQRRLLGTDSGHFLRVSTIFYCLLLLSLISI